MTDELKESNPKDAISSRKAPLSCVPLPVLYEAALGMLEGTQYGRHNYRVEGVKASVYYDATQRHVNAFWEGEDIDPKSQVHHLSKAISSLMVLRDAIIRDNWTDDRPPATPGFIEGMNEKAAQILDRIEVREPWTQKRVVDEIIGRMDKLAFTAEQIDRTFQEWSKSIIGGDDRPQDATPEDR